MQIAFGVREDGTIGWEDFTQVAIVLKELPNVIRDKTQMEKATEPLAKAINIPVSATDLIIICRWKVENHN